MRDSTRATSEGADRARKLFGRFSGSRAMKVPAVTSSAVSRSYFSRAVAHVDALGLRQLGDVGDPLEQSFTPPSLTDE